MEEKKKIDGIEIDGTEKEKIGITTKKNEIDYLKMIKESLPSNNDNEMIMLHNTQEERNEWFKKYIDDYISNNEYDFQILIDLMYKEYNSLGEKDHDINYFLTGITTLEYASLMLLSLGAALESRSNGMSILFNVFGEKAVGKSFITDQALTGVDFLIADVTHNLSRGNEVAAKSLIKQFYATFNVFKRIGIDLTDEEMDRLSDRFINSIKMYSSYLERDGAAQKQIQSLYRDMVKSPVSYSGYHNVHPTQVVVGSISNTDKLEIRHASPSNIVTAVHDMYANLTVNEEAMESAFSNFAQKLSDSGSGSSLIVTTNNIGEALKRMLVTAGISLDGEIHKEGHASRVAGINIPIKTVVKDATVKTNFEWIIKTSFLDDASTMSILSSVLNKSFNGEYSSLLRSILDDNIVESAIINEKADTISKIIFESFKNKIIKKYKRNNINIDEREINNEVNMSIINVFNMIKSTMLDPISYNFYSKNQLIIPSMLLSLKYDGEAIFDEESVRKIRECCIFISKYNLHLGKYLANFNAIDKFTISNDFAINDAVKTKILDIKKMIDTNMSYADDGTKMFGPGNDIFQSISFDIKVRPNNSEKDKSDNLLEIQKKVQGMKNTFVKTLTEKIDKATKMFLSNTEAGIAIQSYLGNAFKTFAYNLSFLANNHSLLNNTKQLYYVAMLNSLDILKKNISDINTISNLFSKDNVTISIGQNRSITQFFYIMNFLKDVLSYENYKKIAIRTILGLFGGINNISISLLESLDIIYNVKKFEVKEISNIFYDYYNDNLFNLFQETKDIKKNISNHPELLKSNKLFNDMKQLSFDLLNSINNKKNYNQSHASINAVINNFDDMLDGIIKKMFATANNSNIWNEFSKDYMIMLYNNSNTFVNKDKINIIRQISLGNFKIDSVLLNKNDFDNIKTNDITNMLKTLVINYGKFKLEINNKNNENNPNLAYIENLNVNALNEKEVENKIDIYIDYINNIIQNINNQSLIKILNIDTSDRSNESLEILEIHSKIKEYKDQIKEIEKNININNINNVDINQDDDNINNKKDINTDNNNKVIIEQKINMLNMQANRVALEKAFNNAMPSLYLNINDDINAPNHNILNNNLNNILDFISQNKEKYLFLEELEKIIKIYMSYNFIVNFNYEINNDEKLLEQYRSFISDIKNEKKKDAFIAFNSAFNNYVDNCIEIFKEKNKNSNFLITNRCIQKNLIPIVVYNIKNSLANQMDNIKKIITDENISMDQQADNNSGEFNINDSLTNLKNIIIKVMEDIFFNYMSLNSLLLSNNLHSKNKPVN